MKILYHHRIASKDGQYVHVEELTNAFKRMGHELIIVGPSVVESEGFGSEGGIVSVLKCYMPKFIYEILEFSYSFYVYSKLVRAIKINRPDVIYERYNLFLPAGIWAKKKFNLPLLLEVNSPLLDERSKYNGVAFKWLASWSERYVWKNADHVLPVTNVLAKIITEKRPGNSHLTVIPNGIDLAKLDQISATQEIKKKYNLNGKLVLGFTGFVRAWHGLEKVVELLKNTTGDTHLLIVGDGPASKSILAKAKYLGVEDQVTITGIISREDVINYVSLFDIALQPSVVSYASPLKLFEYMFLAKAIVAPDTDNIKEILTDKIDALLFDPNKSDSFSDSIQLLINDIDLRKSLGIEAKNTINKKRLTWDENAKKITKIIQGFLACKKENTE